MRSYRRRCGTHRVTSGAIVKLLGITIPAIVQGGWDESPLWEGHEPLRSRLSWMYGLPSRGAADTPLDAVAKTLARGGDDAQLVVLQAHCDPIRRVLLEAWRNQQLPIKRSPAFRRLGASMSLRNALTRRPRTASCPPCWPTRRRSGTSRKSAGQTRS